MGKLWKSLSVDVRAGVIVALGITLLIAIITIMVAFKHTVATIFGLFFLVAFLAFCAWFAFILIRDIWRGVRNWLIRKGY